MSQAMMLLLHLVALTAVVAGHLAICIASYNRFHSLPLHFRLIKLIDIPHILVALSWPAWIAWQFTMNRSALGNPTAFWSDQPLAALYAAICIGFTCCMGAIWLRRILMSSDAGALVSNDTIEIDVARELGLCPAKAFATRICALVPCNQLFHLSIHVKTVRLPSLPAALDGLTITHLSDFHLCGKIGPEYFQYVVERANDLRGDLIAITGDILEKVCCYEWLDATLGRLKARHGVYFVLGNHDKRLKDVDRLRRSLSDLGLVYVGDRCHRLNVDGCDVLISGNEMPWFGPAPAPPQPEPNDTSFRILLSHSPDQISWAKQRGFDLVLAGHTHGGQIRLPVIGPIVCPSRFGVKYASGVFAEDATLMHVSRGLSGVDPMRINCPPELTKLVLVHGSPVERL